jgi:hypothetical protein
LITKLLFAGALATFWEEVLRPEMVTSNAAMSSRRAGDTRPVVRWDGHHEVPLPFETGQLAAIVLVDAVERSQDPQALLADAERVASRVYVVLPALWTPGAWLDPRNRWIRIGSNLYGVPGRRVSPVEIPRGVSLALRHSSPVDSVRHLVEQGLSGWLT